MPVTIHDVGFSLHALSLLWVVLRVHVTPRKVYISWAGPWAQSTCACWHSTPRRKSLTALDSRGAETETETATETETETETET